MTAPTTAKPTGSACCGAPPAGFAPRFHTTRADATQAMGMSGISKSRVSSLCKDIDERVGSFPNRRLDGEWPYLWLDATYLKVRDGGCVVSRAGQFIDRAVER